MRYVVGFAFSVAALVVPQRLSLYLKANDTLPLLTQADVHYEGACTMPGGPTAGTAYTAAFGAEGISIDQTGDSGSPALWVTGFPSGSAKVIAKFALTDCYANLDPLQSDFLLLYSMTKLAGWVPADDGHIQSDVGPATDTSLAGLYQQDASHLLMNMYHYYGASYSTGSLIRVSPNLSSPAFIDGPFRFRADTSDGRCGVDLYGTCGTDMASGAIVPIPSAFQSIFQGDFLVTGCCYSVIDPRTNNGGGFSSFNMSDVGSVDPIPAKRIAMYPVADGYLHPTIGSWDPTTFSPPVRYWCGVDSVNRSMWFVNGYRGLYQLGTLPDCSYWGYGPSAAEFDAHGGVLPPVGEWSASGSDASTSVSGTRVTVPNADLTSVAELIGSQQGGIWLTGLTSPVLSKYNRSYTATSIVTAVGNSGASNAYVDVATPFANGLTSQAYKIGEISVYEPDQASGGGHGPKVWPKARKALVYDTNDVPSVLNGTLKPWELLPVDTIQFDSPIEAIDPSTPTDGYAAASEPAIGAGGSIVDQANRKLLVVQAGARITTDYSMPAILVYGIDAPAPPPSALPFALACAGMAALVLGPVGRKITGARER